MKPVKLKKVYDNFEMIMKNLETNNLKSLVKFTENFKKEFRENFMNVKLGANFTFVGEFLKIN